MKIPTFFFILIGVKTAVIELVYLASPNDGFI
jgi:hypothetical protein